MKKLILKTVLCCCTLLLFLTACQRSNQDGMPTSLTTIEVDGNLKITYSGILKLNDDKTDFKSISQNGYVNYKKGDKKLLIKSDGEGKLKYQLDDGKQSLNLDEKGKKFIAETIQDMLANGLKTKE